MEILGATSKLTKQLNNHSLLVRAYGADVARRIEQRLFEFENAVTLTEISHLPPPRLHSLTGDRSNQFAVDVSANWRLVFEGYNGKDELSTTKSEIVTIQILGIEDYHGR